MSSSQRPQARKPYIQVTETYTPSSALGVAQQIRKSSSDSSTARRRATAAEMGLVEQRDGSFKEIADNNKIFRIRIVTSGSPEGRHYHLRITLCGKVWWTPSFWTSRAKVQCFTIKPRQTPPQV